MHKRAFLTAASAAVATAALLGTATAASATEDTEVRVSILAVLAGPATDAAPEGLAKLYAVDDVLVGPGPELTAADLDPLSDEMCGDLEVDIDLDAMTAAVTGTGVDCPVVLNYLSLFFTSGLLLEDVEVIEDGLFGGVDLLYYLDVWEDGFDAVWLDESELGAPFGGTSTFALVPLAAEAEPVDEPEAAPVADVAEVELPAIATEAEAAAPIVATPTFTG